MCPLTFSKSREVGQVEAGPLEAGQVEPGQVEPEQVERLRKTLWKNHQPAGAEFLRPNLISFEPEDDEMVR